MSAIVSLVHLSHGASDLTAIVDSVPISGWTVSLYRGAISQETSKKFFPWNTP